MKKLILLLTVTFSVNCFSQAITVNTTTYSVPQLVNSVLINSPCVSATNITWKTGTNFGSSNGIGYFQNTNPNFPIQSGVILSTGDVSNAKGPNTTDLNDGASNWQGDAALESILLQSGITMNSTNATVLEFDFIPISPNFSFDFLFASEEYGNFQCQFSDAFAFLLTNTVTGVTTNLAVVPNTTSPISVVTIRDFLYNSSCPSANADYFGSYNGGSAAAASAINFNGQTKLLNANATLIPNTPYHIKLVIADRTDSDSDSAIFMSSNSFNIGQDVLGQDLTIANNTAICNGQNYNLTTGLNPANYTFSWKKGNVTIAGANAADLTITEPGNYSVTYQQIGGGCQPITDAITIEYHAQIITPDPVNLYKCNTGSANYAFDLALNTPIITAGLDPATTVKYYASSADANNNNNALPNTYNSAGSQTIYAAIKLPTETCSVIKTFDLLLVNSPTANQPSNITKCETSFNAGTSSFNLTDQNNSILNGQSNTVNTISFFTTLADANANTNPIATPGSYTSGNAVIYVRVQNATDNTCFNVTSFSLIVKPKPQVDIKTNVVLCSNYTLPALTYGNYFTGPNGTGTPLFAGDVISATQTIYIYTQPTGASNCGSGSSFTVKIVDPGTLAPPSGTYCGSYALPTLSDGKYFTGIGGTGTQLAAGTEITSTQTIYVYFQSTIAPYCVLDVPFTVTIAPTLTIANYQNVFACTSYTLPSIAVGKYFTQPDGAGTQLPAGTAITTTQTIYVYATTNAPNNCVTQGSFKVFIGLQAPANIAQCNGYTLPALEIGKYYTGPAGSGTEIAAGTVINTSQTVYIYVPTNDVPNCTDNVFFTLSIAQPQIDVLSDVTVCDSYTLPVLNNGAYYTGSNGTGALLHAGDVITASKTIYIYKTLASGCSNQNTFRVNILPKPLTDSRADVDVCNAYVLTSLTHGNYYTGPNGTGTMLSAGTSITTSQTIYIYAVSNTTPACSIENSFKINIFSIQADAPANVTACDSYTLPALTHGDYYSQPGGPAAGEGTLMHAGDVITSTQTIYVYIESGLRINCTDENSFTVTINHTPIVQPVADVNICNSYTLPQITVGNYFTGPNGTGTMLHEDDIITSSQTIYVYAQTATTPNCSDEKSFNLSIFNVDEIADITICESYTLPALAIGNYYTGPLGTGTHLNAGQVINTTQLIYIYANAPFSPACYDESSFTVTIVDTPVAYNVPTVMTTVCDEDGTNDGITVFDLTQLNSTLLGNQTSAEFMVQYFESQADAVNGTNPITSTSLQTVFAKVSNTLTTNCFDLRSINIKVNLLPNPAPKSGIICYVADTNTLLRSYTFNSELSAADYTFIWANEAGETVGTASTYEALLPGIYTLITTSNATGCSTQPIVVEAIVSEPAVVKYTTSDDFSENQIITIEAIGAGDYEYQLDNGPFQDSPVFEHVSSGVHKIVVNDKNGCGNTKTEVLTVDYPKFFTPNGDGYNDTWNINDIKDQPSAKIYIFDRYGKQLKVMRPGDNGWDGSFQSQNLPATDYWFTITYVEDGETKEFKSHFTLKR